MAAILGISAFYHDSAAAFVVDGQVIASAQEERFTRIKHDASFPQHALAYCLAEGKLQPSDLDYVVFYEKPLRKFDRLLETYLSYAPAGYRSFRHVLPQWLREKLFLDGTIRRAVGNKLRRPIVYASHHQSHAASAFYPSPFEDATIVTIDGVGEWATTTIGIGRQERIELLRELRFPHSLGLLYSAFTYHAGFRVNSGEYKLMGLAPYGQPRYVDLIFQKLMTLKNDGSFQLNMRYFNYCQGLTMTNRAFDRLFGGPPRKPESPITDRELDLAASIQAVTEEAVLRLCRFAYEQTKIPRLCLAGGVALNCVANGRVRREGPFETIWIQPAAGDAGGALGAALLVSHQLLGTPRAKLLHDSQQGSMLGPAFDDNTIAAALESAGTVFHRLPTAAELCERTADLLANGKVVGWFQGRMEFGPRALGCRSILGDPRLPHMQSLMNRKIKFRESFRPFAPSVLREYAHKFFDVPEGYDSPYMLLTEQVHPDHRIPLTVEQQTATGLAQQHVVRSTLPAITHVDGSARIQTVDSQRSPLFHQLLTAFHDRTGCPVLINTSFNVRGEPLVCTPADAVACFAATDIDALAIGHYLLFEEEQPATVSASASRAKHLARFALD